MEDDKIFPIIVFLSIYSVILFGISANTKETDSTKSKTTFWIGFSFALVAVIYFIVKIAGIIPAFSFNIPFVSEALDRFAKNRVVSKHLG